MSDQTPAVDFRALFDAHFAYVWGALRRLGVAAVDCEDLAHEVFLHVHRHLAQYDRARPMRPWLFGFAYRVASEHRRRAHHRREVLGAEPAVADARPRADEVLAREEEGALLRSALAEIDLDRRAVLVLHEWDGASIPDVAASLGIPLNTAYSRLRVAREELAAAVRRLAAQRRGR